LKSKVNVLELIIRKFSTGEKSFNILLGNQLFVNNRKGLGFGRETIPMQTTNHFVRQKRFIPKCTNYGEIGHSDDKCLYRNSHKTFKQFRKPNNPITISVKYKMIWVPKGTIINANGVKYKQIWVWKDSNVNRSGSTICGTVHISLEI